MEGFKRTNIDLNELAVKVAPNLSGDGQVSLTQIKELNAKLQAQADKVAGLLKSDPQEAQRIIRQEVLTAGSEINNLSKTIVDQQEQLMKEAYDNNSILVDSIRNMILLASVLAIIIALTFGLILGSKISRPLSIVNRQLKNIAQGEGDLTRQIVIQSKGEFGEIAAYFNLMVQNLRKLIQQIGSHAEQFTFKATQLKQSAVDSGIASERITKTVQGLAVGSERQHNKVDESSRIIDLISDRARQVALNMEHASSAVDRTKKAAFQGNEAINSAMIKMSSVHDSLGIVNGIVQQLEERSKEIEKSIHLITDIARRTNLIALNAGIESARVGEHGKGFTVVASEIRTLAGQSSVAAETIFELIVGIREETQQAARFMLENAREASEGLQVVNIAGSFFDHIVQSIQDIHQEFVRSVRSV
ncbi:methyl-accepting chemotaxis protein [Paenibacillus radicis (ex Xue et al. 2023)]|uniref:Methyl-accepting chemotaxis protein n=1 Tax=Paenibacillus radicis (ex Xue et al. 2023) TaxID=2972489 RepID=A0ABT1YEE0_9BACL|nr:methyl-accepting chemotaxis protein [Paenibacillus radicis (ex Xue et al. 2023)]MCR8631549.1 methyl-accepting chemotaxis protein [Paenibacillus radicis (ex Xue et al. 2023)]